MNCLKRWPEMGHHPECPTRKCEKHARTVCDECAFKNRVSVGMHKSLLITPSVLVSMEARKIDPPKQPEDIRQFIRETLSENYCLDAGPEQRRENLCRSNDDRRKAEAPWDWCERCLRYWVKKIMTEKKP